MIFPVSLPHRRLALKSITNNIIVRIGYSIGGGDGILDGDRVIELAGAGNGTVSFDYAEDEVSSPLRWAPQAQLPSS